MTFIRFNGARAGQFSHDWKGSQGSIRFMLDQADGLIEAIRAGQLTGVEAATNLQLMTRSSMSDAHTAALLCDEAAYNESNKAFWDYALAQAEKARDAFDLIQDVPETPAQARVFMGQRANCDDHVQFFRTVCSNGTRAAINLDTGPNPHKR